MRFLLLLFILANWFNFYTSAQSNKIDSLKKVLYKQSKNDRGNTLEELCYQFFISSRQDSLLFYQPELEITARKKNDSRLIALSAFYKSQIYFRKDTSDFFVNHRVAMKLATNANCLDCLTLNYLGLGLKYRNLQDYNQSIENLSKGLSLLKEEIGLRAEEIKCNLHIALSASYHYKSKYAEALQHGLEAARIAEQLEDLLLKQKTYNSLSAVYGELHSPDNNIGTEADREHYKSLAKYYMIKTYQGSLLAGSKKTSAVAAYNLGLFFSEENNFDSASFFLNQSINLGQEENYIELLSNVYNVIGGNYTHRDPDSAIYYFDRAISYSKQGGFISNMATAMSAKASILQHKGQFTAAMQLGEEALQLSLQADEQTTILNIYKLLSEIHEQEGNQALAFRFYKKYISLKDSIVSAQNFARIEELTAKYDSERKDSEIRNLSQTASIQALEIRQRNIILISLLIFIIFTVSGLILYFRQRALTQKQKQLQLENRFLRFQLNPHFLSNALVSIQRFLFETDSHKATLYLGKFSKLMRQFLEYSRKDLIPIEDEIEALKNYLEIQKLTFSNGFTYTLEVDEKLDTALDKIPPMFAQPFVENALEHGINGIQNGQITITFLKDDNHVLVTISDNGNGLHIKSPKNDHQSLATTIIRERIELLNRTSLEKIKLIITNNPEGKGTRVEIKLPIYS